MSVIDAACIAGCSHPCQGTCTTAFEPVKIFPVKMCLNHLHKISEPCKRLPTLPSMACGSRADAARAPDMKLRPRPTQFPDLRSTKALDEEVLTRALINSLGVARCDYGGAARWSYLKQLLRSACLESLGVAGQI